MAGAAALAVVDVQQGLIDGFETDGSEVLPVIGRLARQARDASVLVVLIQHCGPTIDHPLHRSRSGWALDPMVEPGPDDLLVEKRWSDAFCETNLDDLLREASVTRMVLVGAQTEYCVDTTARRAASMGYDVELVGDGHTTSSDGLLSRQQIIAHHNQTFANLAVDGVTLRVIPSDEVSFD